MDLQSRAALTRDDNWVRRAVWAIVLSVVAGQALFFIVTAARSDERLGEIWTLITTIVLPFGWSNPASYFAVLAGLLALEAVLLGWRHSSIYRLLRGSRSARTDLLVAGVHVAGWSPLLTTTLTAGALWFFGDAMLPFSSMRVIDSIGSWWLQGLVVFVAGDFLDYWYHRIMHRIEFLWEAHKYHHSATEFTMLTGNRLHALEDVFRQLFVGIPLVALGTPAVTYLGARYLVIAIEILQHSMLPWTYGWFGRWVVYSPVGHRIHHSVLEEHWDRNYGNILVIWDRLFGTWYAGTRVNETVDVTNNPYNQRSIAVEYLLCVALVFHALRESVRTGSWRLRPRYGHQD